MLENLPHKYTIDQVVYIYLADTKETRLVQKFSLKEC